MILVCPACNRRYRQTTNEVPQCVCGAVLTLREVKPFVPEIVRCSACGGAIDPKSAACQYCGSKVKEFDTEHFCDSCFAFLEKSAKYCSSCGQPVIDIGTLPLSEKLLCPRDRSPLHGVQLGTHQAAECEACGGLWLSTEEFENFLKTDGIQPEEMKATERRSSFSAEVHYISCPECGAQMARQNYDRVSGVVVDTCRDHGVWLDRYELEDISKFLRSGGKQRAEKFQQEEEARKQIDYDKIRRLKTGLVDP